MTVAQFFGITLATFLGGWAPAAINGQMGLGAACGVAAVLVQQLAIHFTLPDPSEEEDEL